MYQVHEIRHVHLEVTTRCNAKCPMCARTLVTEAGNELNLTDLSLASVRSFFPPAFIRQLRRIYLCGNYGDPAAAQETLEICKYLRASHPELRLGIHSNGGVRSTEWWRELGAVVNYCHFGIDGLADTNHLYRRGVSWDRVMANVQAFQSAGMAEAEWDYIVFAHNEHQVEEARGLAAKMGFTKFRVKVTSRFAKSGQNQAQHEPSLLVRKFDGTSYQIELPKGPEFVNESYAKEQELIKRYGNLDRYYDQVEIQCKVATEKSIYVSATGNVYPCCWLAMKSSDIEPSAKPSNIEALIRGHNVDPQSISLHHHSIANILSGPLYSQILPTAWSKDLSHGKPKTCARICGKELDVFKNQFTRCEAVS
jgi:MoaA/NifB/PqqE/SkfB family radical SAM enzyme